MELSDKCSKCSTPLLENDVFCSSCGFPERGTDKDRGLYEYRIKLKKNVLEDAQKKLRNVKILLIVIAVINLLVGIYYLTDDSTFFESLASFIAAAVFLGCAFWVEKQPMTGIIAGFSFWGLLQLAAIFVDPVNIVSGILWKILIVVIFIKGIASAKDAKKFTEQLKELKAA